MPQLAGSQGSERDPGDRQGGAALGPANDPLAKERLAVQALELKLKALKLDKEFDALKNPAPTDPPPEPPKKPASRFSKKSTWVSIGVVSVIGGILLMASGIGLVFGAMLLVGGVATLGATGIKTAWGKRKEIKAGAEDMRGKLHDRLDKLSKPKQPEGPDPGASANTPAAGPAASPPGGHAASPPGGPPALPVAGAPSQGAGASRGPQGSQGPQGPHWAQVGAGVQGGRRRTPSQAPGGTRPNIPR